MPTDSADGQMDRKSGVWVSVIVSQRSNQTDERFNWMGVFLSMLYILPNSFGYFSFIEQCVMNWKRQKFFLRLMCRISIDGFMPFECLCNNILPFCDFCQWLLTEQKEFRLFVHLFLTFLKIHYSLWSHYGLLYTPFTCSLKKEHAEPRGLIIQELVMFWQASI